MPKLYFRYGAMNSSKTANLLMVAHNYQILGKKILLMKPQIDCRVSQDSIHSRIGLEKKVDILIEETTDLLKEDYTQVDCILVDECQFLSEQHVNQLRAITEYTPVLCYGLRTDYRSQLFAGSKRLMEIADTIEEIKTICVLCNHKAIINAKYKVIDNGKTIIKNGTEAIDLGAEEKYQAMCWTCWTK